MRAGEGSHTQEDTFISSRITFEFAGQEATRIITSRLISCQHQWNDAIVLELRPYEYIPCLLIVGAILILLFVSYCLPSEIFGLLHYYLTL